MHNRKNFLAAMIVSGLAAVGIPVAIGSRDHTAAPAPRRRGSGPMEAIRRGRIAPHRSRYQPHESTRECARRVGGKTWAAFKAADRVRRGLPANKET